MSSCTSTAGVKYVMMYDSRRSQVSLCLTPAGVRNIHMCDSCRSQVSPCMTPAGVKYHYATNWIYDSVYFADM